MLDQVRASSQTDQPQQEHNVSFVPNAVSSRSKPFSSAILVWLKCNGDSSTFISALERSCGVGNFNFVDAQPTQNDPAIWRCRFEEVQPAPHLERRTSALLKRLSLIGTRVRAERVFQRAAVTPDSGDEYLWDGYTRRPIG